MIQTMLYHNGKSWILDMTNNDKDYNVISIPLTDEQADDLKELGVPIYEP